MSISTEEKALSKNGTLPKRAVSAMLETATFATENPVR
jgi:hypothetical protein